MYSGRWGKLRFQLRPEQFFNVNDLETADFVSKYLGQQTQMVRGESLDGQTQPKSATLSAAGRALLTADEVRRLPRDEQILFYEGENPVRADKLRYYIDNDFKDENGVKKFAPDPYYIGG